MAAIKSWQETVGLEFRDILEKQAKQLRAQQDEIERLRGEVVKQSTRNHELSTSCHERIEQLVRTLNSGAAVHQEHELMHTRAQLDIALKERDLLRASSVNGGEQQAGLGEAGLQGLPPEYVRVVQCLEDEITTLHQHSQQHLQESQQHQQTITQLQEKLEQRESERTFDLRIHEQLTEEQRKVTSLREANSDLRVQYDQQAQDMQTLLSQTDVLQRRKSVLRGAVASAGGKLREGEDRVEESVRVVEAAILEKDAALVREQQTKREVVRLRAKLEDLTISAGEKTKTQLLKARDERNNTIKKMSQELNELQLEKASAIAKQEQAEQLLEISQNNHLSADSHLSHERQQRQAETAELQQRVAQLESRATAATTAERVAREREAKAREQYAYQASDTERRMWQLTETVAGVRADYEKAKAKLRAQGRAVSAEKTSTDTQHKILEQELDQLRSLYRKCKKEFDESRSNNTSKEHELRGRHEQELSKLYGSLAQAQATVSSLLEQKELEREATSTEHGFITRSLEESLAAAMAHVTDLTAQLAKQTARTEHAEHKLEQTRKKLQECEEELFDAEGHAEDIHGSYAT